MAESKNSQLTRRELLRLSAAGIGSAAACSWFAQLSHAAPATPTRNRACILLWMSGGPSQIDTFDLKPGHRNGGSFKPIATSVPGMLVSEHLPRVAEQMEHIVPIRSMQTKEGDHARGTYYLHTGYTPQGPVDFPTLGSLLSHELGDDRPQLPNFVSISPFRNFSPTAFSPGFLGPQRSPLIVGDTDRYYTTADGSSNMQVRNLEAPGIGRGRMDQRLKLLGGLDESFRHSHSGFGVGSHQSAYGQAVRMMRSKAVKAFDLDEENDTLRDAYGRNQFGQGCLLARRLVERGVKFIEISLSGVSGMGNFAWDSHGNNFEAVRRLSEILDPGWGTLLSDLQMRGLLESTLVVWMGEFGRTPRINASAGRDHFPNAWTTVLCGGGINSGQYIGRTSKDGMRVEDRPVSAPDLIATICRAMGIDPEKQNMSNVGRPIQLADPEANAIEEVLA